MRELATFVRNLGLRLRDREAEAPSGVEARVLAGLRRDLEEVLAGLLGERALTAPMGVRTVAAERPWTAHRGELDRLFPGATDAWLAMEDGGEGDGYAPVWSGWGVGHARQDGMPAALWAVHADGRDRWAWILMPARGGGWEWGWRQLLERGFQ